MNRSAILKIIVILLLLISATFIIHCRFPSLFRPRTSITKFTDTSDGSLQSYYNQALNLNPRGNTATTSATFLAVGDIMLSRNVAAVIQKSNNVDYPFLGMADILKSTDFNFANLESPVSPLLLNKEGCPNAADLSAEALAKEESGVVGGHSMVFGAPCAYIQGLVDYNFKILNLANNHALDQGLAGVDVTRSTLDNLNIQHEGAGDNLDQAWQPAVIESNGIKIGFVGASYSSINDSGKTTNNYVARIGDLQNLKSSILNLKSQADFVVVAMHAGTEYTRAPNAAQIAFAHAAIDDGADMVIGSHPHWVQTVEKYKNKYIFYSLGNFIFDQAWSQDTMEGLTLKITLSKIGATPVSPSFSKEGAGGSSLSADDLQGSRIPAELQSIELIPVIITNSQPRPATADETKKILEKIGQNETLLAP